MKDKIIETLRQFNDEFQEDVIADFYIEEIATAIDQLEPEVENVELSNNAYEILLENGVFDGMKPQHQIDIQEALRMCAKSHTPPQQPSVEPKNTLNRDKVDAILYDCFRFSDHYGESAKKASDALCSLSLPTQKRKDPVDPLDSYYLKDGKWHCVECDKPMNLPTLSEGEMYDKLGEYARRINKEYNYYSVRERSRMIDGYEAALKELTKPKEER